MESLTTIFLSGFSYNKKVAPGFIIPTIYTIEPRFVHNRQNYQKPEPSEKLPACRKERYKNIKQMSVDRRQTKSTTLNGCTWSLEIQHVLSLSKTFCLKIEWNWKLHELHGLPYASRGWIEVFRRSLMLQALTAKIQKMMLK